MKSSVLDITNLGLMGKRRGKNLYMGRVERMEPEYLNVENLMGNRDVEEGGEG